VSELPFVGRRARTLTTLLVDASGREVGDLRLEADRAKLKLDGRNALSDCPDEESERGLVGGLSATTAVQSICTAPLSMSRPAAGRTT
jgi:hypothetical protein